MRSEAQPALLWYIPRSVSAVRRSLEYPAADYPGSGDNSAASQPLLQKNNRFWKPYMPVSLLRLKPRQRFQPSRKQIGAGSRYLHIEEVDTLPFPYPAPVHVLPWNGSFLQWQGPPAPSHSPLLLRPPLPAADCISPQEGSLFLQIPDPGLPEKKLRDTELPPRRRQFLPDLLP